MKFFATTFLLITTLAICGAEDKDGWEIFREHFKLGNPELKTPPKILASKSDGDIFTVTIANASDETIAYEGYFSNEPQYFTSELVDGAWTPRPNLWCGTGMWGLLLEPGDRVTFSFQRHLKKRQIFVIFRDGSGGSSLAKVWDPTIAQKSSVTTKSAPNKSEQPSPTTR
ncbi:MAG: hypothetical protein MI807_02520 [Verrucomicrobiales bacterium]|nr:hypothetical protein [Verrucomicrobiales bacterium]